MRRRLTTSTSMTMKIIRDLEVVDEEMAEVLRRKTPAERIAIGFSLWTWAREMLLLNLAKRHPDWDRAEVEKEVVRRMTDGPA